jgi:threonylcarbamoyladenosine tRNA methylthiotransferase MtaB
MLTARGRKALREWIAAPSSLPRLQHEALVGVLSCDLGEERDLLGSLDALRVDIDDERARLREAEEIAATLPHRERYLRLVHRFGPPAARRARGVARRDRARARLGKRCAVAPGLSLGVVATFSIRFLGCKVSHVDAHEVRERLLADGHEEVADSADVAVVNTCCVTHEALTKSRKAVSRAARTHRCVYVTGCGANLAADAFAGLPENVVVVSHRSEETPDFVAGDVGAIGCVQSDARLDRVRAFVKVQDGCSFSCSFCVIPLVRGASRSRAAAAVLAEIDRRVAQGHREVVLTGINLGCYRDRAAGYDLPRLVREAGATPSLERLRLSSIEINHVGPELVAALRETPTVSRHLHVPLQSGDDRVLRAMGRRYAVATYLRRLAPLQDELNLTSDVIVGFPAEDERAFANTLRTVHEAGLTKVHVFPYSPRPGTATAASDTVPADEKKERGARLRAASREACLARWRTKIGRDDAVLVDRPGRGYGDDYSPWLVRPTLPVGELARVRGAAVTEEGIRAA